ncbi:TPA: lipopolysaccharide biosynthesis protein [Photobacterium damselae]
MIKNIAWNIGTQLINNVVPIILIPFMILNLGADIYGEMILSLAVWGIPNLLVQFGFQVTASKKITQIKDEREQLSSYIINVYLAKFMLFLFGVLCLILSYSILKVETGRDYIIYTVPFILGSLLNPAWVYFGTGEFKKLAKLTIVGKMLGILIIFFIAKYSSEHMLILTYSSMNLFASLMLFLGLVSSGIFSTKNSVSLKNIFFEINEAKSVFLASSSTGVFQQLIPIVLGHYFGPVYATLLNVCDAIRRVLYQSTQSIFQVVYQNTNKNTDKIRKEDKNVGLIKVMISILSLYLLAYILIYCIESYVVRYFFDVKYFDYDLIYWVLLSGITNMLVNAFGIQVLIPLGYNSSIRNIFIFSSLMSMPIMFLLVTHFNVLGAVCGILVFDSITLLMFIYKHKTERIKAIF